MKIQKRFLLFPELLLLPVGVLAASLTVQITVQDSTKNITHPSGSITVTSGDGEQSSSITTSTNEMSVSIDSQITGGNGPGLIMLRNLSTTTAETVDIGTATGVYVMTLNAKDTSNMNWAILPVKSDATNLYFKAATNTPQVYYTIYERGN